MISSLSFISPPLSQLPDCGIQINLVSCSFPVQGDHFVAEKANMKDDDDDDDFNKKDITENV